MKNNPNYHKQILENKKKLKSLFPEIFTNTVNINGETVETVDIDELKQLLGLFSEDSKKNSENYELNWFGKKNCLKTALEPVRTFMKPLKSESLNFDKTDNLFIEGDNLEGLKHLQTTHFEKIKMIYIDPPYNTGKNFLYSDDYSDSMKDYLKYTGSVSNKQNKISRNADYGGRIHTKWLNMMWPRLYLAEKLLREDGVIFISIDDNEAANLRKLCDEIFGEENFVENIVWLNKEGGGGSDSKLFRKKHEYILVYAKNKKKLKIKGVEISNLSRYKLKDNHYEIRGPYYLQKLAQSSIRYSQTLDYPIIAPDGTPVFPGKTGGKQNCYRWSKSKTEWGIKEGFIEFKKDKFGNWQVYTKQYLKCDNNGNFINRTNRPPAVIEKFSTTQSSKYLKQLFKSEIFKYSKPHELIIYLCKLATDKNDIVLDFFAGSCSTAHAVLELNEEEKNSSETGNRKFIMIQLPEPLPPESEAFKAGYKTISDIGKERIRKVFKIIKENREKTGLPETRDKYPGFKVLKLENI